MKKIFLLFICIVISDTTYCKIEYGAPNYVNCNMTDEGNHYFVQNLSGKENDYEPPGFVLPSIGTINVLIIFAQFPDDNFDINNSLWPAGKSPADINLWLSKTWTDTPIKGSLTHYFNDMSFNKLKFIGKTVSVISPHTRQWYLNNQFKRGDIHKEIILQLDSTMDFSEFDNWKCTSDLHRLNQPDHMVDMIIFVWRNIADDLTDGQLVSKNLDFNGSCANIGGSEFSVDNGQRLVRTGNFYSGVTVHNYLPDRKRAFCAVVHEFAHYLFGDNRYHSGFGFWGMLSSWGVRSIVANSYERSKLGWIKLKYVSDSTKILKDLKLSDYVTTGEAICLKIAPNLGQYFYIENHQCISYWETEFKIENIEKGLYVIRQDKVTPSVEYDIPSSANLRLIPAEGRFNWEVNQLTDNLWGSDPEKLPVFKRLKPERVKGYHSLDFIPWSLNGIPEPPSPIIYMENENGQLLLNPPYKGMGNDAFKIGYNEVFTPWSNPNSYNFHRTPTVFGFKINSLENKVYSLNIYSHTSIDAPPSKPIGFIINMDPVNYSIKLSWQPNLEPDLSYYEISRNLSEDKNQWETIAVSSDTSFTDSLTGCDICSGVSKINYKIRANDSQGLYSVYSSIKSVMITPTRIKENIKNIFKLQQNYPNPFNADTRIKYSVLQTSQVQIKVYDVLGNEIETFVNEEKPAGTYEFTWNAANLPSGVYFYKLTAGKFTEVKKMILLK